MLCTLPEDKKSHWSDHVSKVVHAYNCTKNKATGYSPFYLLFGHSPHLPIDLIFNTSPPSTPAKHREFVEEWKEAMQQAYKLASEKVSKSTTKSQSHYNRKASFTKLLPGDRVLVRNQETRGTGKLRAFWEDKVYIVTKQLDEDNPVYEVKPEEKKGKSKVLHRNLLLPCDHLPIPESTASPNNSRNEKKRTVQHKGKHHHNFLSNELPEYEDDLDSDNHKIPSFLPVNHPVQPALTINVPADQPQILTPPPTPVPSSPVHLHAEHTDDHVEPPLTPLPINASPIDNTTPNVVAPNPSDPEHVEEVPTCTSTANAITSIFVCL